MENGRANHHNGETSRPRNFILQRLPDDQYRAITRYLVPVDLPSGMSLSEPNRPLEYIYFPVAGLISVHSMTERGESVEVGSIGREGLSGVSGLLGHVQMPHSVVVQGAGTGLRIRSAILRDEFVKGGVFAQAVNSFIYMQMVQMAQSVLCGRLHSVDMRMARWMLTASDLTESDVIFVTQELLSQMLGSRRSTVTVAAGELQRRGLIDYSRGKVRITDRTGLESASCECYQVVRGAHQQFVGRSAY